MLRKLGATAKTAVAPRFAFSSSLLPNLSTYPTNSLTSHPCVHRRAGDPAEGRARLPSLSKLRCTLEPRLSSPTPPLMLQLLPSPHCYAAAFALLSSQESRLNAGC